MSQKALSTRGLNAAQSSSRVDLEVYFEALQNVYHPKKNPEGALPLNMAENKLCWPILRDRIERITRSMSIPDWVAGYTAPMGAPPVLEIVANFLSNNLTGCKIDPKHIGLSAGASSVIEMTSFILADEGDVAVFPAPSYPVYKQDVGAIAGMERFDLITHHELSELQDGSILSTTHLDATLQFLTKSGKKFRLLVLTNPDNPTGIIYTKVQLDALTEWCMAHHVHLIVNEIYGLSLINTKHPKLQDLYPSDVGFQSFAQIIQEKTSPYLHLWYAFSKDFGISGFRVGLIYSLHEVFLKAYGNLNIGHMVSNHTQWIISKVLEDQSFVEQYIRTNQRLLTESFIVVVQKMQMLAIPFVPARGSLFLWIDLSAFLTEQSDEAENVFWMRVFNATGILLTPGAGFGHAKKGQFRIVFTFLSKVGLGVAMNKFGIFIEELRPG